MIQFILLYPLSILLILYGSYRFKWFAFCLLLVGTICLPFFSKIDWWGWFDYCKMYSVLISVLFCSLGQAIYKPKENFRQTENQLSQSKYLNLSIYISKLMPFFLAGNILEANLEDLFTGNFLNAFAGMMLVLTIPNFWGKWYYDPASVLGFGSFPDWCIAYTLWNLYFIQAHIGAIIHHPLPLMITAIFPPFTLLLYRHWHLWFFCRAFSLAYLFFILALFPDYLPVFHFTLNEQEMTIWSSLNLSVAAYVAYRTIKEKRNCLVYTSRP